IEKIYEFDEEEIFETLEKFEKRLLNRKMPKNTTVYNVDEFQSAKEFMEDIHKDLALFKQIKSELEEEELVQSDPKREVVFEKIKSILDKEPNRKIVLFTEYTDTVLHLEPFFRGKLGNRLLICDGGMNRTLQKALEQNFNAQYE